VTAPLSRRWLWLAAAAALILTFAQSPGKISPDTKLDLTANPLRFLARAFNLTPGEILQLPAGDALATADPSQLAPTLGEVT